MTEEFAIEVVDRPGQSVVRISGDLDLMSAPVLKAALDQLAGDRLVVVDCSAVRFMDSSGLFVFLATSKRLAKGRGSVVLRNASIPVRHVLEIAGFEALLEPNAA